MEKDGVRLTCVRAPKNNEAGFLNLSIRAGSPAQAEDRRQTDDARGMSSPVASIDVVAAYDSTRKLLSKKIKLVRCLRTAKDTEGLGAACFYSPMETFYRSVEGYVPASGS